MATLDATIYTRLAAVSGVTDIVSTRIYYGWIPQGATLPCVSYTRISTMPVNGATGHTTESNTRLQVDCWATTQSGARTLADAVKAALGGWNNASSPYVADILPISDSDLMESPDTGSQDPEHRVSMDFSIWWTP